MFEFSFRAPFLIVSGVAAILVAAAGLSAADQVQVAPQKDNTLYESPIGHLSNGAGDHFFAGRNAQGDDSIRRGLLTFDIAAALPAGAVISNVALRCYLSRETGGPADIHLHRLSAAWGEGASHAAGNEGGGAPAEHGDATWLHTFHDTDFWFAPGGDFIAQPSASVNVNGLGFYTWNSTPGLVADVQSWLDAPEMNFGWIVLGDEATLETAKRFDTRENKLINRRPRLTVTFTPPATIRTISDVFGTITRGGVADLAARDDDELSMQSQFGFAASEPNLTELQVNAQTSAAAPTLLHLEFESRLDNPGGVATVRLFDIAAGMFQKVGTFGIGQAETYATISDVPANSYVAAGSGDIVLRYRNSVVATFAATGFTSFHDLVRIRVEE